MAQGVRFGAQTSQSIIVKSGQMPIAICDRPAVPVGIVGILGVDVGFMILGRPVLVVFPDVGQTPERIILIVGHHPIRGGAIYQSSGSIVG